MKVDHTPDNAWAASSHEVHAPVILDVAALELSAAERERLLHPLTGGVILFARNFASRAQVLELCASIKAQRADLLICVDHEGGRVQRFRTDGFTHLPPMGALGELWMQDTPGRTGSGALRACDAATAAGYVLAAELRACGVDLSFTPVLDLDWGRSEVIGNRAFHADARVVSLLAKSVMHGLLQAGMAHCGKHFPGHGFVQADSHVALPVDTRSLEELLNQDAAPYAWLSSTLTAVMPAHVIYSQVDAHRPAGFSKVWIENVLRQQLRFDGAVFSDDLGMQAARCLDGREVSFAQAGVEALNAGCDMVLLCNQSIQADGRAVDEFLEALTQCAEQNAWQPSPHSEARRIALLPQAPPLDWDELMVQPAYMHALDLLP